LLIKPESTWCCLDDDNTVEGAVPTIGPNGEIYVSWAGPAGLVFDKSLNHGETWLNDDIFVADIPGGWAYDIPGINRCNGMPVTACDISNGAYHGNIYINWSDQRNGINDTDIWFSKSTDSGNSWSAPKRVNDDPPGKHQFFTWMTIDQTNGYIYIVFYDRRNHEDIHTDVFLAVSQNGGDSFQNYRISESPFKPNQDVFFGDYTNISAHNNIIRPVWARLDNTTLSIWTALIDPDYLTSIEESTENSVPKKFDILSIYPNPFNNSTMIRYQLPEQGTINIKIYDVLGKQTDLIYEGNQSQGVHQVEWKADKMAAGVYFVQIEFNNELVSKKVVFSK